MSDPMSNREIEDVLTSIRRLVAQEGDRSGDVPRGEGTRLVLTEAQRVTSAPLVMGNRVAEADAEDEPALPGASAEAEVHLAETSDAVDLAEVSIPAPDFSKLEATIAELEAAVSATDDEFEGGPADEAPKPSNVTALYGRLSFAHRAEKAEAPAPVPTPEPEAVTEPQPAVSVTLTEVPAPAEAPAAPAAEAPAVEAPKVEDPKAAAPEVQEAAAAPAPAPVEVEEVFEDTILDEEMLRALISQIVREELQGHLGERITQQVRKLVRSEIAKALDDRGFL